MSPFIQLGEKKQSGAKFLALSEKKMQQPKRGVEEKTFATLSNLACTADGLQSPVITGGYSPSAVHNVATSVHEGKRE